jgi:hypothetical protein
VLLETALNLNPEPPTTPKSLIKPRLKRLTETQLLHHPHLAAQLHKEDDKKLTSTTPLKPPTLALHNSYHAKRYVSSRTKAEEEALQEKCCV